MLNLGSSLPLKSAKMVLSIMIRKPFVRLRNTLCLITDNKGLTKESMGRDLLSPLCFACSCGTLFSRVEFQMFFAAHSRYVSL